MWGLVGCGLIAKDMTNFSPLGTTFLGKRTSAVNGCSSAVLWYN